MRIKLIGMDAWEEDGRVYTFQVPPSLTHNITYVERVKPADPQWDRLDVLRLFDELDVSFATVEKKGG